MIQSIIYTEPVLCHSNYDLKKAWYVYFKVTNLLTGEERKIQKRGGINCWHDKKNRLLYANAVVRTWKEKLENGWHPFDKVEQPLINANTPFDQALEFALSQCIVASKSKKDYACIVRFVLTAAKDLGLLKVPVCKIEKPHIMLILNKVKEQRKWQNQAYNKNKGYLSAIIGRIQEWQAIKYNPVQGIKDLPTAETRKFVPYTDEEKKKITEYMYLHHYRFFVYLMVIYHTGMRPKEVLALKVKDIDLLEEKITIIPDLQAENSKTKKIRTVPINPHLMRYIREMHVEKYPNEYYVFGSPFGPGGNRGSINRNGNVGQWERTGMKTGISGVMRSDYFMPSPNQVKRDTVTKLWERIVIKKLNINKYQYAMKHTGADDKIMAGVSIDALKELYGHESKFMTETYVSKLKEVYRKEIVENSPEFITHEVHQSIQ